MYPTFQLNPFGIETDKHVLLKILSLANQYRSKQTFLSSGIEWRIDWWIGYLNIPQYITDCYDHKGTEKDSPVISFITSSPQVLD